MRVAMVIVSMLVVATQSEASTSCMSKTEARRHFGLVHIYWHGPNHCWDATPSRRRHVEIMARRDDQQAQRRNDQPKSREPGSREPGSEVLTEKELVQKVAALTSWDPRPYRGDAAPAGANWVDRWVDVVQVVPPPRSEGAAEPLIASAVVEHKGEPMMTSLGLALVFFGMALTLWVVQVLLRYNPRET